MIRRDPPAPGDPDFDRVELVITRKVTYKTRIPMSNYRGMTVDQAIDHEYDCDADDLFNRIRWADEKDGVTRVSFDDEVFWRFRGDG